MRRRKFMIYAGAAGSIRHTNYGDKAYELGKSI